MDNPTVKKKKVVLKPHERKLLIESKLNNIEAGAKWNISPNTVSKIRRAAVIIIGKGNRSGSERVSRRKITIKQEDEIIKSNLSGVTLGKEYGVTPATISKIRLKHGVRTNQIKVKIEPIPKSKKEKVLKVESASVKMKQTTFEYENKQKLKAYEVLAKAKEIERLKLESGYVAVKTGIRAFVLRKI